MVVGRIGAATRRRGTRRVGSVLADREAGGGEHRRHHQGAAGQARRSSRSQRGRRAACSAGRPGAAAPAAAAHLSGPAELELAVLVAAPGLGPPAILGGRRHETSPRRARRPQPCPRLPLRRSGPPSRANPPRKTLRCAARRREAGQTIKVSDPRDASLHRVLDRTYICTDTGYVPHNCPLLDFINVHRPRVYASSFCAFSNVRCNGAG